MKKILLSALSMFSLLSLQAQDDSTSCRPRKLRLDEINLVSSYYTQDGENAAVTGGIGSQQLNDIANIIELKFIRYDKQGKKHTLTAETGIDHYTSASSDRVDLKANSSASHADTRLYPSISWTVENQNSGITFGAGLSASSEYDYQSFGGNVHFAKKFAERGTELSGSVQAYLDKVKLILPVELRQSPGGGEQEDEFYGYANRNSYSASFTLSQIVNKNLQLSLTAEPVTQKGFLSLPFYRVYVKDGTVLQERLPSKRFKFPVALRANYFAGDRVIFRTFYRFYHDDWGINAHTASIELPVKITPFFSVTPFYRYYQQSAADYFAPYREHEFNETYLTSNYDLSKFSSSFFGAGVRIAPVSGLLGIHQLSLLEFRYGYYVKSYDMHASIVSLNITYKRR